MSARPRRRTLRVIHPALQVKLPLYLLTFTAAFLCVLTAIAYAGFTKPVAAAAESLPPDTRQVVRLLAEEYAVTAAVASMVYASLVLGFCITYAQRFVGPMIAFRRHLESLKNGDYGARVALRTKDAFRDIAEELNHLAQLLENETDPGHPWSRRDLEDLGGVSGEPEDLPERSASGSGDAGGARTPRGSSAG
jgi:hypothetical protein